MLEIIFSIFMLLLPFSALLFNRILPVFLIAVIGANPYVTAGSLFISLLVKFELLIKPRMNGAFFRMCLIWLSYGLILSLGELSYYFITEYIQLLLAVLFVVYIYHTISSKERLFYIVKLMVFSGVLLALFEIFIFIFSLDLDSMAFIGKKADNYSAFYLVVSTIVIPLFLHKNNKFYTLVILCGLFAIYINESRAMLLLALLIIVKDFLLFRFVIFKVLISVIFVLIYKFTFFDSTLIQNPDSVFSVLNFESNFSNLERMKLLQYSYELFINNFYGYGLGSSHEIFVNNVFTVNGFYSHPHNTLAFLSVELGVVGVFIYIYFFYSLYKGISLLSDPDLKSFAFNMFLVLFLYSLVDAIFYNGLLTLIIFLCYGIVMVTKRHNLGSSIILNKFLVKV